MCGTIVLQCTCDHKFQDEQYGRTWRLHNMNDAEEWWHSHATCTVCGRVKEGRATLRTKEYMAKQVFND